MSARPLRLALVAAALLAAPAVVAAPIASVQSGWLNYDWGVGSITGSCGGVGERISGVLEKHSATNLVVSLESDTRRATWTSVVLDPSCPLQISIQPGVFPNPCDLIAGKLGTPALTSDPYFHPWYPGARWFTKSLAYADGGSASYYVSLNSAYDPQLPSGLFGGECRSGDAWATFRAEDFFAVATV